VRRHSTFDWKDVEKAQNLKQVASPGQTLWKGQAPVAEYAEGPASEAFGASAESRATSNESPKTHERIAGDENPAAAGESRAFQRLENARIRVSGRPETGKTQGSKDGAIA
jgi:hypothetical protein